MRKKLLLLQLTLLISLLSACSSASTSDKTETDTVLKQVTLSADYPEYNSAEELVEAADLVFSGTVKNVSYEELDVKVDENGQTVLGSALPYTIYEIEVSEVYLGETAENTIYIKCLGGIIGDTMYVLDNATSINKNETYLFMTKTYSNSYPSLVNVSQAIYNMNTSTVSDDETAITLNDVLSVLENK